MYFYRIFDYTILSDYKLEERQYICHDQSEHRIRIVKSTPQDIDVSVFPERSHIIRIAKVLYFRIPKIAYYIISYAEGKFTVRVIPLIDKEEYVSIYLLSWIMGIILMLDNRLAMHGSTVASSDYTVMVCGASTAGKSTTIAQLCDAYNYSHVTDDISLITWNEYFQAMVLQGISGIKLWTDSIMALGWGSKQKTLVREGFDKYRFFPHNTVSDTILPLKYVYFITPTAGIHSPDIKQLSAKEAFIALYQHTYCKWYVKKLQFQEEHFKKITQLAKTPGIRFMQIIRPIVMKEFTSIADIIAENIKRA